MVQAGPHPFRCGIGQGSEVGRGPSMTKRDSRDVLADALRCPSYEILPLDGAAELVVEHVPKHIRLTATASQSRGLWSTVELAEHLSRAGYGMAPHLPARLIEDRAQLGEIVGRLKEAGVRDVFVVAGEVEEPAGEFNDAYALIAALHEIGRPFDKIGIAGYPEGHPFIDDEALIRAMHEKAPYAHYIISQICFDARLITGWARQVDDRGVKLPIRVGMPGAVNRQKLMRISASIGLGESARFLKKQGNWLLRMFLPGGYSPTRLVGRLRSSLADPRSDIEGLHIYTFNEVERTEAWRREMLERFGTA